MAELFSDRNGDLLVEALLSLFAAALLILILLQIVELQHHRKHIIEKGDWDNDQIYKAYQR